MKKKLLFLMTLLTVSLLALAEMSIFVYQKDGAKIEYLAGDVDSIGFVNFHNIVFDANGSEGFMEPLRVKESESVTLPANTFTKSAFAFTGWNTAADGRGTAYADQATITITAKITLFAQWEPMHAITFNANGGEGNMDVFYVKDGESVTLPANTFTNGLSTFVGWNNAANGSGTAYADKATVKPTANITLYAQWEAPKDTGIADGHEWVDLGLPSGTKWATMNVGADSPEDYGSYIAWGETTTKSTYKATNYKWRGANNFTYAKYCTDSEYGTVDNKTILEISDDAANASWGGDWRMPTREDHDELRTECTWTWTTQNGVNGYKVTSKTNGNSIFLPAAGFRSGSDLKDAGSSGYYWSSSLSTFSNTGSPYNLYFDSNEVDYNSTSRTYGLSVRPVLRIGFTYDVIFDSNGGEGTMPSFAIDHAKQLSIPANKFTRPDYEFICWNTKADGTGVNYEEVEVFCVASDITLYAQWYKNETNITHEYVDLGLSVKWATCNVGATKPEETGYFFAWGETRPKAIYSTSNYKWCKGTIYTHTKYCTDSDYGTVDNKTTLDLSDDAANANWGGSWRMPTKAELDELRTKCTWTWTTQNGVNGYMVTSKTNGNSIFLPATGFRSSSDLRDAGSHINNWSSSLDTIFESRYAYDLFAPTLSSSSSYRSFGLSVRPVLAK